ncbi:MAG: hypothetical protein AAB225_29795 [Acidobacteriota bacterium]
MSQARPNPVIRLLPSLTDVAFLMPVVFLFGKLTGARYLLGDGDTGWHIRAGEWMLANGRVPDRDLFSFTKAGEPWYAWEWLWDVLFAWLHQRGGMEAVVLASLLIICLTAALLYRLVRRKCGDVLIAIAVTFLAVAASSLHWLARPHLFTLLFAVAFCWLLERAQEGRTRLLLALPLVTILWANLHGGFFVGILLIGAYAAGEMVSWAVAADRAEGRAALRRSVPYWLSAAGCLAASFLNPYTWRLHWHIARYLSDSYHFRNISEFLSLSFQHPVARYFEALLALGALAVVWSVHKRRFTQAIMVAGWAHLALYSARNIPIYAVVSAPAIAWTLKEMVDALAWGQVAGWVRRAAGGLARLSSELGAIDHIGRAHLTSGVTVAALGVLLYLPAAPAKCRAEYDPKRYPAGAIELLRRPEFAANVFADDEWGDYLIYRLHPHIKVFIDGRSDFYGATFGEEYLDLLRGKHAWQRTLDRYDVGAVLLRADASLASTLKETSRWRVVYDDGVAILFERAAGPRPESERVSAAGAADFPAIARSRRSTPVIDQSQRPTRGE